MNVIINKLFYKKFQFSETFFPLNSVQVIRYGHNNVYKIIYILQTSALKMLMKENENS